MIDHVVRIETEAQKSMRIIEFIILIFLGIEKAYDVFWREELLHKVASMGNIGRMYRWIRNFLGKRTSPIRESFLQHIVNCK